MRLNGKEVAGVIKDICKERVQAGIKQGCRPPCLAILQVGDESASNTYVKWKRKDCQEIGIIDLFYPYDGSLDPKILVPQLKDMIRMLNGIDTVDGIIVQLPIPGLKDKVMLTNILSEIHFTKDVDGLRPDVFAKINVPGYNDDGYYPCTPHGIIMLLDYYGYELDGMATLVIGRSNLVGKPLAQMLLNRNAELTVCHTHCTDDQVWQEMQQAKLIISAVGKPHRWDVCSEVCLPEHPILIDVGTSVDPITGKLVGDFGGYDFLDHYNQLDSVDYTPVPGGIGPMTRAALMLHTVDAWERHMWEKGIIQCPTKEKLSPVLKQEYMRFKLN